MINNIALTVSGFVAMVNQTLEYAYNSVIISGELSNFKISKNKWVYFDLKDELASVRFFGTVYVLPGPLEDGMTLEVLGNPRLHPQFGFTVTVQSIRPVGEGSIKKAANLLEMKLRSEGLFNEERKRPLPYPPSVIGLITSKESAAFADFSKILNQRWRGIDIQLIDVQVQGEAAPGQISDAVGQFNQIAKQPDVIVLIRGGGSADDLQAFSTEQVTRSVAASRIPTLVAIGHETDISLSELAADMRASTPSNAAELLVPDRLDIKRRLHEQTAELGLIINRIIVTRRAELQEIRSAINKLISDQLLSIRQNLANSRRFIEILDPNLPLTHGYSIVRNQDGEIVRSGHNLNPGDIVNMQMSDAIAAAQIKQVKMK
jgi:exodeoxyribonuclease VII large subunit